MPTVVQFRRGTTTQNDNFLGANGEISVDTTLHVLRVADGSTQGGFALVGQDSAQTLTNKTLSAAVFTNAATGNGSLSLTGNITGGNLLTGGSVSATGNITGANLNSSNADLAEMYCADANYLPGTVVEFGGAEEITISTQSHSTRVAGIVSTNPSYLMNSTLSCDNAVVVALTGRVPCRVVGTIAKGDRLVASDLPGIAMVLDAERYEPGCIIGKALENYDSGDTGIIEVAVGRF